MQLEPGDRVRIIGHWNWPEDCTGVVGLPTLFAELVADENPWRGHTRTVPGRRGPVTFVWIIFDDPQADGDGDGPYPGGEVEVEYVMPLDARN